MKKICALLLIAALALGLSACSMREQAPNLPKADEPAADSDLANEWTGEGGCYVIEPADLPEGALAAVVCQNKIYSITQKIFGNFIGYILHRGDREVYRTAEALVEGTVSDQGIWLCTYTYIDGATYQLTLVSPTGAEMRTINLAKLHPVDSYSTMAWAAGNLYILYNDDILLIVSETGELTDTVELPGSGFYPVVANNGQLYFARAAGDGNDLYQLDTSSGTLSQVFSCGSGVVCDGGEDDFLLLQNSRGLYSLSPNGEQRPIVIWAECSLTVDGLMGVVPIRNGEYLLQLDTGMSLLKPAEPTA